MDCLAVQLGDVLVTGTNVTCCLVPINALDIMRAMLPAAAYCLLPCRPA
jgi:hypothetical protein